VILRHADYGREQVFDADVVVVGTGAGGAVAGAELAEAGLDVVFVEEGAYHSTSSFSPFATDAIPRLYRDGSSTMIFGRPNIPYLEGRCVGGSTVVNGGMTYRAPEHVLARWAKVSESSELGPKAMEPLFARVESRIHASPQLPVSVGDDNRLMVEGAKKLGWRFEMNRRNQERCVGANNCIFGCPTGAKQSTLLSYVPRALAAGARCLTDLRVDRLAIRGGRCVGVVGRAIDPRSRQGDVEVTIRARATVVAAGAVQTPLLLLRHRLGRPSRRLGANFLCHPNAKVLAVYPFDVRGWQGVNQWSQVRQFEDDGILLAENMIPPGALAAHITPIGKEAWDLMRRYNQMVATGVLVEDSTSGRVSRAFGVPLPRYSITAQDHRRFIKGALALAELHFAMGAEYCMMPFLHRPFARSMDDLRGIDERSVPIDTLELFTVHLMGTAAMGSRPDRSVVDPSGQVWDLPGCYVADASLFPSAIGVNPQVTVMALATLVAMRMQDGVRRRRVA
jgi:choline dehydrogenase-like flavoprotein